MTDYRWANGCIVLVAGTNAELYAKKLTAKLVSINPTALATCGPSPLALVAREWAAAAKVQEIRYLQLQAYEKHAHRKFLLDHSGIRCAILGDGPEAAWFREQCLKASIPVIDVWND